MTYDIARIAQSLCGAFQALYTAHRSLLSTLTGSSYVPYILPLHSTMRLRTKRRTARRYRPQATMLGELVPQE
jgi:hypothetical protein